MRYILTFGFMAALNPVSVSNAQSIGIVECDAFLKKYETCVSSMSGADTAQPKDMMQKTIIEMRKQYLDLKSSLTQDQMKDICVQQATGMKDTFEAFFFCCCCHFFG